MIRLQYAAAIAGQFGLKLMKVSGLILAVIFAGFMFVTVGLISWLIRDSFTGRY